MASAKTEQKSLEGPIIVAGLGWWTWLAWVVSEGGKARSGAKRAFAGLSWMQLIAPQAVIQAKLTP